MSPPSAWHQGPCPAPWTRGAGRPRGLGVGSHPRCGAGNAGVAMATGEAAARENDRGTFTSHQPLIFSETAAASCERLEGRVLGPGAVLGQRCGMGPPAAPRGLGCRVAVPAPSCGSGLRRPTSRSRCELARPPPGGRGAFAGSLTGDSGVLGGRWLRVLPPGASGPCSAGVPGTVTPRPSAHKATRTAHALASPAP